MRFAVAFCAALLLATSFIFVVAAIKHDHETPEAKEAREWDEAEKKMPVKHDNEISDVCSLAGVNVYELWYDGRKYLIVCSDKKTVQVVKQ